jgi:hypothetical protein
MYPRGYACGLFFGCGLAGRIFLSILREAVLFRRAGIVFQPLDINLCE